MERKQFNAWEYGRCFLMEMERCVASGAFGGIRKIYKAERSTAHSSLVQADDASFL
jgi:hypothetical protein